MPHRRISKKFSKELVALHQLFDAIELFNRERYLSAITLAGAAEEILKQLLIEHSKKINIPLSSAEDSEKAMFGFFPDVIHLTKYHAFRHHVRNELKHHGGNSNEDYLEDDFKQIALNHISGALINYKVIHNEMPSEQIVIEFCKSMGLT